MEFKDKVKAFLVGLVGVLGALFLWERSKRRTSEALLENQETKEKLVEIDKTISKNEGTLEAEETKREEIKKDLEEEKNETKTNEELEKFFNRPKSD